MQENCTHKHFNQRAGLGGGEFLFSCFVPVAACLGAHDLQDGYALGGQVSNVKWLSWQPASCGDQMATSFHSLSSPSLWSCITDCTVRLFRRLESENAAWKLSIKPHFTFPREALLDPGSQPEWKRETQVKDSIFKATELPTRPSVRPLRGLYSLTDRSRPTVAQICWEENDDIEKTRG